MLKKFGTVDNKKLSELEKKVNMKLPEDYKKYLEETNGGTTDGEIICFHVEGLNEEIALDILYGIDLKFGLNILDWCNEYNQDLLESMIIIGHAMETGIILLINQNDWKGIYLWDNCLDYDESTEEECIYKISDSFDEFINGLKDE